MKKIIRILGAVISAVILMSQSMFGAELMMMHGKTNSDTKQVTLLVLDSKITDRTNIEASQIKYIDQGDVDENGNFVLMLPFFDTNEYSVYSNLEFNISSGDVKKTVYVSSSGSDSNTGFSAETPFKTLEKAYENIEQIDEIVLLDNSVYSEAPAHSGMIVIRGENSSVELELGAEVSLNGELTFDNVLISGTSKIYANGYKFKLTETVAMADSHRLSVYGGKKNANLTGDTHLELLGGKFSKVYGGCSGGTLTGNTNVILGGNANKGDGIDDQASNISPCYVFGGGENGSVTGKGNILLTGNAVSKFVCGAGNGANGNIKETNVCINGGKVMNVYGGSTNTALNNCDTYVTLAGGLVEAIFGGCESAPMTGNTYITLAGGEVSRRVYSGCYNEWGVSGWGSHNFVTGTTNLAIFPEAQLITKTELHSENQLDMGVYAGSRDSKNNSAEESRLIFLDGSYSKHKGKIGKQDSGILALFYPFKSFADYELKATTGGMVYGTNSSGKIYVAPDNGYYASINNVNYDEGELDVSTGTTDIEFLKKEFYIYNVDAVKGDGKAEGSVNINADNTSANEPAPMLYVSVFDEESGKLIDCAVSDAATGVKSFSLNCEFEEGKKYIIKAMMWNGNMEPLTAVYSIELK